MWWLNLPDYPKIVDSEVTELKQVIALFSHKWSPAAKRYSVLDKEATGIYLAVKNFNYLLMGKSFAIETDHRNLLFMVAATNARVIRQRLYLEGHKVEAVRHVEGKHMAMPDLLSRDFEEGVQEHMLSFLCENEEMFSHNHGNFEHDLLLLEIMLPHLFDEVVEEMGEHELSHLMEVEEMFKMVHGPRVGHWAGPATWKKLNAVFPGHKIPYRTVENMVRECEVCQRERLKQRYNIEALQKTHKRQAHKVTVGADLLSIGLDKFGYQHIVVLSNFFSKRVRLFKAKDKTAESLARCFFIYVTQHGLFDEIRSDPGSDFTSSIFDFVTKWLGIKHSMSLVNRPQSNNVEGSNKQILRHLRCLVNEESLKDQWSDDTVLAVVEYIINTHYNREVGVYLCI